MKHLRIGKKYLTTLFFLFTLCSPNFMEQNKVEIEVDQVITDSLVDHNYFDTYLHQYPSSAFLIGMKAYYLLYNNDNISANLFLSDKALEYPQISGNTYFNFAKGLIEKESGELNAAKKSFSKSIKNDINKQNKWLRYELYFFYKESNFKLAKKYLQESLKIDPGFIAAVFELSYILFDNEKKVEAFNLLDSLILIKPYSKVFDFKGHLFIEDNNYLNAKECFIKANKINKNASSYYGLGLIMNENKSTSQAIEFFDKSVEFDEFFFRSHIELSKIFFDIKNYQNALYHIDKAIKYEQNLENYLLKINIQLLLKKYSDANQSLQELKGKYGRTIDIDYFEIIMLSINNEGKEAQELIFNCRREYSVEDFNWLKSNLKPWGINILK